MSLTVRDGFGTGDVSRQTFTVIVDHPPEAREIYVPENIFAGSSISFDADVFDTESGMEMEIYRDLDVEDGSITERDERILTEFTVRWDFDIESDLNEDGDAMNDWVTPIPGSSVRTINTWEATGYYTVLVEVCDGMGQCDTLTEDIEVVPEPEGPPRSQSLAPKNGSHGWPMLALNWPPSSPSSLWLSSWAGWSCANLPPSKKRRKRPLKRTPTLSTSKRKAVFSEWTTTCRLRRRRFFPRTSGVAMTADMFVRYDAVEAMS